ncbi:outer membrane usher protein [Citrobacter portucalensis]|uniref:Outer membrane usher protein n=1 Tax=Citrobacter portucalensis TaxID=1639133 RepID=A0A9X4JIJ6_9ENTR|nr:outer membrane usher protein [Citrobacter portucalensis]MDE9617640.1 outer membrane usher protein [Citrobacter portucalensis]
MKTLTKSSRCSIRLSPLSFAVCGALYCSQVAIAAENVQFDSSFLMGNGAASIDLNRYSDGNPTPVGIYNVSVFVNEQIVNSLEVPFVDIGKTSAAACLSAKDLTRLHIKLPDKTTPDDVLLKRDDENGDCLDLPRLIEHASVQYDSGEQRLYLTIPQASLNKHYNGYVDPSLWEKGINAALLSYSINAYHNEYDGTNHDSLYSAFNSGINLLGWRFRAAGNYNWTKHEDSNLDFQNRYVQRDIPALRSQLILGEAYTTGETFDSVQIRGARFYSDSRMLPSVLASFAPVIHGVANTNAKVTVTQGGYKIYETTVPPGAFTIDDISPSGYGSDLIVTIEEADGSKRSFSQPFSSVMQMQRPGVGRWDISGGQVHNNALYHEPNLLQGSFYYGLNNYFTGYSGVQITDNNYLAALLGVGVNTPVGAFALDVTQSQTEIPDDQTYRGQSYRVTWNKLLESTNTTVNLAAYRYSTREYLGLNDALTLIDDATHPATGDGNQMGNYARTKNQFTVSISQPLLFDNLDLGSFFLSGSWTDYWSGEHSRTEYNLGYSKGVTWGSYSINLQRTWDEYGQKDDAMFINISIPIANLLGGEHKRSGFTNLTAQANTNFDGDHQFNMSSNGNSEDNNFTYSVNTGYSVAKEDRDISSIGGYASYESPWGSWSGSASADNNQSRQYSLSTDGGFVLHSGGLTFSNDNFGANDTMVLVEAPGAKGATLNHGNSTVDRWGYGVTSSLSPYRENDISLDIDTMDNDVELKSTSTIAVPRDGAVVFARFETDQGRSAIVNLTRDDGKTLPFAAEVYEGGKQIGNMGQGGQAFVRGINNSGELVVRWFENNQVQECRASYQFPTEPQTLGNSRTLILNDIVCRFTHS